MRFKGGVNGQEELDQAILKELGRDLNPTVLDHILNPGNAGVMEDPDGEGILSGICEDTVCIQIRLKEDQIEGIQFMTDGCGATVACGSMLTKLARGKSLQAAMRIHSGSIIEALGGLPVEYTHCAELAANTLRAAVRDALEKRRQPWKRMYRSK